jgi:AcrR family transcriptional regulator
MDAGERLVARRGVEGVTLREIALLAGQANSNVVQYHFKNKAGLIQAILEDRMRRREKMRGDGLKSLKAAGQQNDPRQLLKILWLPTLAFSDDSGEHVFCRFVLQCMLLPDFGTRYPLYKRYESPFEWNNGADGSSALAQIMSRLRATYKNTPPLAFSQRLSALSLMFVACAVEFDNAHRQGRKNAAFDADPLLDMAAAALAAPHAEARKKGASAERQRLAANAVR